MRFIDIDEQPMRFRDAEQQAGAALEDEIEALLLQSSKQFESVQALFKKRVPGFHGSAQRIYPPGQKGISVQRPHVAVILFCCSILR